MVLDLARVEALTPHWHGLPGRPPAERAALARAFVAKAVFDVPTTSLLVDRLKVDKTLRRLCGWERAQAVPSEATFSRAFAEFAASALPMRLHETLIATSHKNQLVGHISRDATAIEPQVVVGAAGYGKIPLLRRIRTLENADRLDELRDDEVRVGVTVAVVVARVVDRDPVDGELEVLPLVGIEPTKEHLLGVPRASLVREKKSRRELERVGRVGPRDGLELADRHVVVGGPELAANETTP